MVAATYGFVSAFGQNIALIPTLTTGMQIGSYTYILIDSELAIKICIDSLTY